MEISTQHTVSDILSRIASLQPDATALWGIMNVNQMLCHSADLFRDLLGHRDTPMQVDDDLAVRIKSVILHPEPFKPNLPGGKIYDQSLDEGATQVTDFETDRAALIALITAFTERSESEPLRLHPLAGQLTKEEATFAMLKHLDHHLRQFGA